MQQMNHLRHMTEKPLCRVRVIANMKFAHVVGNDRQQRVYTQVITVEDTTVLYLWKPFLPMLQLSAMQFPQQTC